MKFTPYKKNFLMRIAALLVIMLSYLAVIAVPINGHLQNQSQNQNQSKAALNIVITKPAVGHLYINDQDQGNSTLGITRIIGSITIEVNVSSEESTIDKVEFIIDGIVRNTTNHSPCAWFWNDTYVGAATIKITAYDTDGNQTSKSIKVRVIMINEVEMKMMRLLSSTWMKVTRTVTLKQN